MPRSARIEPRLGDRGGARGSRRRTRTTHGLRRGEPRGRERKRRTKKTSRRPASRWTGRARALAAFERAVGRRRRVRPGVRRGGRAGPRDVPRRFAASIVFEFIRPATGGRMGGGDARRGKARKSVWFSSAINPRRIRRASKVVSRPSVSSRRRAAAGVGTGTTPLCTKACGVRGAPRHAGWGGDTPRRRRGAATRLRVFGGAGWRRGPRRRRVRGGGRGASPPASRAASARRRRGCRGGGHVRGRQSRRGGASAAYGTAGGVSVNDSESFGFYATYYVEFVPISGVPKSGCDRSSSEIFLVGVAVTRPSLFTRGSTCIRSEKALVFGLVVYFLSRRAYEIF